MKRKEKWLYLYSIIGFFLSIWLYYGQAHTKINFILNKNIPKPIIALNFKNNLAELKFMNRDNYHIQVIRYNKLILDTISLTNNYLDENSIGQNNKLMNISSSPKWKPPVNNFNDAYVIGARYMSNSTKEVGEWTYLTSFKKPENFTIVSILIDPNSFYGFEKGIYTTGITQLFETKKSFEGTGWWLSAANWNNRGKDWERDAHFQVMGANGKIDYSSNCGIRINGNATRGFSQKSFKLLAKGNDKNFFFIHDFFNDTPIKKFKYLLLRNSGNDWGKTMFADAFIQSLIPVNLIERQSHLPVKVYINGLYWGLYDLCEKLDENYLSIKYKVKKKNVTLLEGDELEYGKEKNKMEYRGLVEFCLQNSFKTPKNYEEFCTKADINNLALYFAIQIYIVNTDWPNLNVKVFRLENELLKKWKWAIRDLDCSYSYSGNAAYKNDGFKFLLEFKGSLGIIFQACMQNNNFKKILKDSFEQIMNTCFEENNQLQRLEAFIEKYEDEIPMQINRWRKPESIQVWQNSIEQFKLFIVNRRVVVQHQIKKYLEN